MSNYYVLIKSYKDDEVVEEIGPMSESKADRVDTGANINLNHDNYYTEIINKDQP